MERDDFLKKILLIVLCITLCFSFSANAVSSAETVENNFYFSYNNVIHEEGLIGGETLTVSNYVGNNCGRNKNVILYAILYNQNDIPILVETIQDVVLADSTKIVEVEMNLPLNCDGCYVKTFMWDSGVLTTLSKFVVFGLETDYSDDMSGAEFIDYRKTLKGSVSESTDVDYVKFIPQESGIYFISEKFLQGTNITIYNSEGGVLANKTINEGNNPYIMVTLSSNNEYYIKISNTKQAEYSININCAKSLSEYYQSNNKYEVEIEGNGTGVYVTALDLSSNYYVKNNGNQSIVSAVMYDGSTVYPVNNNELIVLPGYIDIYLILTGEPQNVDTYIFIPRIIESANGLEGGLAVLNAGAPETVIIQSNETKTYNLSVISQYDITAVLYDEAGNVVAQYTGNEEQVRFKSAFEFEAYEAYYLKLTSNNSESDMVNSATVYLEEPLELISIE